MKCPDVLVGSNVTFTDGSTQPLVALTIREIEFLITRNWPNPHYAAKPYLQAMRQLDSIDDNYYSDSGKSVVLYFLANAGTWRGDVARQIKKELKRRAGIK